MLKCMNKSGNRVQSLGRNRMQQTLRTPQAQSLGPVLQNPKRKKVTYWAGMRIEAKIQPFDKREDALSKWHTGIANGQLFEKIDFPMKPQ